MEVGSFVLSKSNFHSLSSSLDGQVCRWVSKECSRFGNEEPRMWRKTFESVNCVRSRRAQIASHVLAKGLSISTLRRSKFVFPQILTTTHSTAASWNSLLDLVNFRAKDRFVVIASWVSAEQTT
jgi:hypothetical protein